MKTASICAKHGAQLVYSIPCQGRKQRKSGYLEKKLDVSPALHGVNTHDIFLLILFVHFTSFRCNTCLLHLYFPCQLLVSGTEPKEDAIFPVYGNDSILVITRAAPDSPT